MSVAIFAQAQLYLLATHQHGYVNLQHCQLGAAVRAPLPTTVSVACGVRGSMDDARRRGMRRRRRRTLPCP